jgi:CIC family chloride channel protein
VVGDSTIYRSQLGRRSDSPAHRFDLGVPRPDTVPLRRVMSEPRLVIPAGTGAAEALAMIGDAGLPGAPVVNADGAFIGSLQSHILAGQVAGGEKGPAGRLADVEAMTLPADAHFDSAIEALPASKGGWVPVLDDRMAVVGIVSASDLVRGWQQTMRQAMRRVSSAAGRTATVEGTLADSSPAAGRSVSQLGLPRGAIVVSLVRKGALIAPTPQQALEAGDVVTVLARPAHAGAVEELLGLADQASPVSATTSSTGPTTPL